METIHSGSHISEDLLTEYALGRLPKHQVPVVFEHLLVCDQCNDRYEAELNFKHDLREASIRAEEAEATARTRNWFDLFAIPKPAWAAVAAMALIAVFVPMLREPSLAPQEVRLMAVRGSQAVTAQAGAPINLHLDTAGSDTGNPVTVQIVTEPGREVWRGSAKAGDQTWFVQVDEALDAGRYYVRVLDPAQPDSPLREFQLDVR